MEGSPRLLLVEDDEALRGYWSTAWSWPATRWAAAGTGWRGWTRPQRERDIVQAHGGELTARSILGKGLGRASRLCLSDSETLFNHLGMGAPHQH